jgi:hypothetical protein
MIIIIIMAGWLAVAGSITAFLTASRTGCYVE